MNNKRSFDEIAELYSKNIINEGIASLTGGVLGGAAGTAAGALSPIPGGALLGGVAGTLAGGKAGSGFADKKEDEEGTDEVTISVDRSTLEKILNALEAAMGDTESEDAESFWDKTKDVAKKGAAATGGSLLGGALGELVGGPVGKVVGHIAGAGMGGRLAR